MRSMEKLTERRKGGSDILRPYNSILLYPVIGRIPICNTETAVVAVTIPRSQAPLSEFAGTLLAWIRSL
jgi:hypothetical protein